MTLNKAGYWTATKTIGGREGTNPLGYDYPAVDASGNAYHYSLVETPLEGYPVTYSPNNTNGVQSGVLTAYNRNTSVDVAVEKVDRNNRTVKLSGAVFTLRQLDPVKTGGLDMRTLTDGKTDTQTTGAEGHSAGTLTFRSLEPGYYEISETKAPDGYVLNRDAAFYIRVTETEIQLLQKDESRAAEDWNFLSNSTLVTLQNSSAVVTNAPGAELPHTGGGGRKGYVFAGSILMVLAGITAAVRSRKRKVA